MFFVLQGLGKIRVATHMLILKNNESQVVRYIDYTSMSGLVPNTKSNLSFYPINNSINNQ